MLQFNAWLLREMDLAEDALAQIPPKSRKRPSVALIRLRARKIETALDLYSEYEKREALSKEVPVKGDSYHGQFEFDGSAEANAPSSLNNQF